MVQPATILQAIEHEAAYRFLPIVGAKKGKFLVRQLTHYQPKCVLEVGTLVGYGTILIAQALTAEAHLWTIELDADLALQAQTNLERAGLLDKVTFVMGNALEVIRTLTGLFDFVFLDARKNEYYDYLRLIEPLLADKATIIADNAGSFADDMQEYLNYVRTTPSYVSTYHAFDDDGMEMSIFTGKK